MYRDDARDDQALHERQREAETALEAASLRVRAAARTLRDIEARFERERRTLDEAVADAEDARRRAIYLAADGAAHPHLRDSMRVGAAVTALERAMARKGRPKASPTGPPPPLGMAQSRLSEARAERARFAARGVAALERARARLAEAVSAHDAAAETLEAAVVVRQARQAQR